MSFERVPFRNLLIETKDGEWGQADPFPESVEMVVIRGTDFESVTQGLLVGVPVRHIAGKAAARKTLVPLDILIETAGGSKGKPTGKTTFLRANLFARSSLPLTCASFARFLRIDAAQVEPEFVYWYLQSLYKTGVIETYQVQHTGIARFQFTKFADSIEIPIPSRQDQQTVTNLLGALDDRIALLRETNATLEGIAQALFKSWFVDFDPVRAKMEGRAPEGMDEATAALFPDGLEDSELGLVPKEWRVARLDAFLELAYGKALKATDRVLGDVPVYGSGGVTGFHNESLVTGPSIVIGRKGTVGSLYWEDRPFFPIDTVFYVRTAVPMSYCFYLLQTLRLSGMNTDAAVPGLNRGNVYRLMVPRPDAAVLQAFNGVAGTIRESIFRNNQQAQTLAILRDTLLPRLISGQLRLPQAEAVLEEACA